MKELAEKYITAVKNGYHETPQIVWFLSDGWRNFIAPKMKKMIKQGKPTGSGLPQSLRKETVPDQGDKDLDEQQALIRAKLAELNEQKTPAI